MRVNFDSAAFGDTRFKRLALELGVPIAHAYGCSVMVWHQAYVLRSATIERVDVDLAGDIKGLADAMVKAGLARPSGTEKVRLAGVDDRIKWLEKQKELSTKGVEARRAKGRHRVDPTVNPPVNRSVDPTVNPPDEPYSPDLLFSGSSPDLKERDLVGVATPTPPAAVVRTKELGQQIRTKQATEIGERVLRYLGDKAARGGPPLRLNDARKKRVGKLVADGWCFEDFTAVVWLRTQGPEHLRWLGDPKMDQYVRFETLFGTEKAEANRELARHEYALFNPERARQLGWLPPETSNGASMGGA